jgi:hypothetical protein
MDHGNHAARRTGRVLVVLAATTALSWTAQSAEATGYTQTAHETSTTPSLDGNCDIVGSPGYASGGTACFKAYGDHWYIKDNAADGDRLEVRGIAQWNTSVHFRCIDNAGKAAGWTVCDFSSQVVENSSIAWVLVRYHNGKGVDATDNKVSRTS